MQLNAHTRRHYCSAGKLPHARVFLCDRRSNVVRYCDFWEFKNEDDNFAQHADVTMIQVIVLQLQRDDVPTAVEVMMAVHTTDHMAGYAAAQRGGARSREGRRRADEGVPGQPAGGGGGGAEGQEEESEEEAQEEEREKRQEEKGPDGGPQHGEVRCPRARAQASISKAHFSIYGELVVAGILKPIPTSRLVDFQGSFKNADPSTAGPPGDEQKALTDPSLAAVRQLLMEQVVLPLSSENVAASAPYPQTLLLYGPQQGGKSMLIDALAAECGANVFELGCRNTDGKYEKKKAAMMMHMVFKVAKALAPSIIKFDEAELTWLSDKKKVKAMGFSEPGARILKDMAKEMKDLAPSDRVVLIGESKQPWLCEKGDQKKFLSFFKLLVYVPICDYGSLQCDNPPSLHAHAFISIQLYCAQVHVAPPHAARGHRQPRRPQARRHQHPGPPVLRRRLSCGGGGGCLRRRVLGEACGAHGVQTLYNVSVHAGTQQAGAGVHWCHAAVQRLDEEDPGRGWKAQKREKGQRRQEEEVKTTCRPPPNPLISCTVIKVKRVS
jgi:hypothetical protein